MDISTDVYHLQELDRYASEKPYTMRYVPETGLAVSNVEREKHTVAIKDMRGLEANFTLDQNGFTVSELATEKMAYEDFDSHEAIVTKYLPALETVLLKHFPGSTVDFVSYLVSGRSRPIFSK
jgi:hypothetical protein